MDPAAPLILLIDDEPQQHWRVAALLPEVRLVSCYTAMQAITRCAALPHSAELIGISGAIPFPPKGADDQILGRALRAALAGRPVAQPATVMQAYLAEHAAVYTRRQPVSQAVALLAGSRAVLGMLASALQADEVPVAAQGTSAAAIRPLLALQAVRAVVADAQQAPAARALARELGAPLLCVALSLSLAASLAASPDAVLVAPEPGALGAALAALAEGQVYRDPQIERAYAALGLTANERAILPYVLDDAPPAEAARALGCAEAAYGRARLRLLQRLDATSLGALRARLDGSLC